MTQTDHRRISFLDWLYDQPQQTDLANFYSSSASALDDVAVWRNLIRALAADGLLSLHESLATTTGAIWILPPGRAEVEARRALRDDPAKRASACQTAVLAWLRGQRTAMAEVDAFPDNVTFEGRVFEEVDREEAWADLEACGLVEGIHNASGLHLAQLTAKGRECVDHYGGSLTDYLRRHDRGGVHHAVTVHGNNSGNIASGNRDVTQSATTHGLDAAVVTELFRAVAEVSADLGLSDTDADELRDIVRAAQTAASQPDPDHGWLKAVGARIVQLLERASGSAAATILTALVKEKLGLGGDQ